MSVLLIICCLIIASVLLRGPVVHYWYQFMDWMLRRLNSKRAAQSQSTATSALTKVALDQLTFGPLFNLAYFYIIGVLQGKSLTAINAKVAREYIPLMIANYKVWPLVNLINFSVIPPKLQVLFGNLVSIAWTVLVIQMTSSRK